MTRIILLGSNGLLGSHLYTVGKAVGHEIVGISRTSSKLVDIVGDASDEKWMKELLAKTPCDVLINAVKFKGSTDDCEVHREECWKANFTLPASLASIQREFGFTLVQISSDWVYEGKRGHTYDEKSLPYPQNFYAVSKFAAELAVCSRADRFLILRTTGLFGHERPPRNFFARLLEAARLRKTFKAASDQYSQPISALELSNVIYEILQKPARNRVFNATGPTYLSRYSFAKMILAKFRMDGTFLKRVDSTYRSGLGVPKYLKTDISEVQTTLGRQMKSLDAMIKELGHNT